MVRTHVVGEREGKEVNSMNPSVDYRPQSWTPASHATDPETSHEAEKAINSSGRRLTHSLTVLRLIQLAPGRTTGEIGDSSGLGHMETRKRLSDLKNQGKICMGEPRVWEGSGRKQSTWWPLVEPVQGVLL